MPQTSMKELNIVQTSVKIDVAAIEWPANATALVVHRNGLMCRTDPDESKEGAETSEIRIECDRDQVIGTSFAVSRNDEIRMMTNEPCFMWLSRITSFIPHFFVFSFHRFL